jgi:hypothetical protein
MVRMIFKRLSDEYTFFLYNLTSNFCLDGALSNRKEILELAP